MTAKRNDSADKLVIDTVDLESASTPDAYRSIIRSEQALFMAGRGTREQRPLARALEPVAARGTRDLARDPVEVLRRWPHSPGIVEDSVAPAPPEAPCGKHLSNDKIVLARLALDLYREIEELPTANSSSQLVLGACSDPTCETRINALRGAVIEACLLVQRVVMMTPATNVEIDERVRELLALIER
jgi:hypothetical protein